MNKWLKIMLIMSVVLNVTLIIGGLWARNFVAKKNFELAAITAEAEGSFAKHILTELESGEPERIGAVKKLLQNSIENTEKAADIWRKASEK